MHQASKAGQSQPSPQFQQPAAPHIDVPSVVGNYAAWARNRSSQVFLTLDAAAALAISDHTRPTVTGATSLSARPSPRLAPLPVFPKPQAQRTPQTQKPPHSRPRYGPSHHAQRAQCWATLPIARVHPSIVRPITSPPLLMHGLCGSLQFTRLSGQSTALAHGADSNSVMPARLLTHIDLASLCFFA